MSPLGSGDQPHSPSIQKARTLSQPSLAQLGSLSCPFLSFLYGSLLEWLSFKASPSRLFPLILRAQLQYSTLPSELSSSETPHSWCAIPPCLMPPPPPNPGLSALKTFAPNTPSHVLLGSWGPYCNAPIT